MDMRRARFFDKRTDDSSIRRSGATRTGEQDESMRFGLAGLIRERLLLKWPRRGAVGKRAARPLQPRRRLFPLMYATYIFPRLMDWVLRSERFQAERQRLLTSARGMVLEIGFGTGLNLPHYPPTVTALHTIDPSSMLRTRWLVAWLRRPSPSTFNGSAQKVCLTVMRHSIAP